MNHFLGCACVARSLALFCALFWAAIAAPAFAQHRSQSSAPYFEATAAGEKVENLPLAMTTVDATITGVIADVSLIQVYENRGKVPVEAVYVFPASSRATVYAVRMTIGDRVVEAQLREREEARATYEKAKSEGRSATLLEQQDVGAFRMSLANVLPGDRIKVELQYVELLVPTAGVYEFFFPNTAPQEKYQRAQDPDGSMPRSSAAEVSDFGLSLNVKIATGAPIASIESPSHDIAIDRPSPTEASLAIDDSDGKPATRDFVLRYELGGARISAGALAYPASDGGDNYLLVLAQPPRTTMPSDVPAREYIFVVDVSGSMHGEPLDVSKRLMRDLFTTLKPTDLFNVLLFSGGSRVLSKSGSLPATEDTLQRALDLIDASDAGGGTELVPALETAYALPKTPGMSRSLVLVTDGAIAAGSDASALIRRHLDQGNVFTFGIGAGVVRPVIERLARAGEGEPFLVEKMDEGKAEAARLRSYIDRPVMTGIAVRWEGTQPMDVLPQKVPDLFAERPIVLVAKYRGPLAGRVVFSGTSGDQPVEVAVELGRTPVRPQYKAVRLFWARKKIDLLMDDNCSGYGCSSGSEDAEREIARVGLEHGILTPYTSFVAVTSEVRTEADAVRVDQPAVARQRVASLYSPAASVGSGFSPAITSQGIAIAVASAPQTATLLEGLSREVGGHRMHLMAGQWRDEAHREDAILLRVRRDSAAYAELLRLRPGLAALFALGDSVLVSFGDYSILVSDSGFSDFPPETLKAAVRLQ